MSFAAQSWALFEHKVACLTTDCSYSMFMHFLQCWSYAKEGTSEDVRIFILLPCVIRIVKLHTSANTMRSR